MKYRVKVLKPIIAEKTKIDAGVPVLLRCTSRPIIKLLRERYHEDNTVLTGDIDFLFAFDGIGRGENDHLYKP